MDGKNEYREGLFPSGNCVSSDDQDSNAIPEVFDAIDHGEVRAANLLLAQEACKTCVQLSYCEDQRDAIATELWKRGAGFTVVGGESKQTNITLVRSTLETSAHAFTFDLSKIPSEPQAALSIIRQAKRSGQLPPGGPTPRGTIEAGSQYLDWLKENNAETLVAVTDVIGESEATKGINGIITALFQQKDFTDFSRGVQKGNGKYNRRYKAENIDAETDYPVITQFLHDVAAIKQLGYSDPARKATIYSPAFYKELADTYQKGISWNEFNRIVGENRDPVSALQRHQVLRSTTRQANPDASETFIRAIRRQKGDTLAAKAKEITETFKDYDYISDGMARAMCASNPGDPITATRNLIARVEKAAEAHEGDQDIKSGDIVRYARSHRSDEKLADALAKLKNNISTLTEKYEDDPDMTPSIIRMLSDRHLNGAVAAAEKYKARLTLLTETSDGTVPHSDLRQSALNGITSFREARCAYMERVINNRFQKRAGMRRPEKAALARITHIYPHAEVEPVAENVHSLMNSGVLVQANADATILHGEIPEELHKIFSPKANLYLTFSSEMHDLSHLQRLVVAHKYDLMPLLYGYEANPLRLETLLNGKTIAEYYDATIAPLLAKHDEGATTALSLSEIIADAHYYQQTLRTREGASTQEVLSLQNLRDATLVVGGHTLYLSEPGYDWNWDTEQPELYTWLQHKITTGYAPQNREAAFEHARNAIQTGALELLGETPQDFRLVFSNAFYENGITDLERAAVANAMGIDQLLFGSDLGPLLQRHFGDQPVTVQLQRSDAKPTVVEISSDQLAMEAEQDALAEAAAAAETMPLPDDPFERLLTFVYGPQPHLEAMPEKQRQKIASTLISVFGAYAKGMRDEGVDFLEDQQDVFMAWSAIKGNDLNTAANTYGLSHDQIEHAINHGVEVIGTLLGSLSNQRLTDIYSAIQRLAPPVVSDPVADVVADVVADPVVDTTSDVVPDPIIESTPLPTPVSIIESEPEQQPIPHEDAVYATATTTRKAPISTYVELPVESTSRVENTVEAESTVKVERPADEHVIITGNATELGYAKTNAEIYFNQARSYPLLKPEQEVELAKAIEAGVLAQEKLDNGTVPKGEEADYQRLVRIGEQAKQTFINSNLRLVMQCARKYPSKVGVNYMDYIQEGNLGLITAVQKFDYTKGYKFSTYAINWIKQRMRRASFNHAETIYTPLAMAEQARYLTAFTSKFTSRQGRPPKDEEVCAHFTWEPDHFKQVKDLALRQTLSLDFKYTDSNSEEGSTLGELIQGNIFNQPDIEVLDAQTKEVFADVAQRVLKPNLVLIVSLHYGLPFDDATRESAKAYDLEEGREYSVMEIASILGMKHQSVSDARFRARRELAKPQNRKLLSYLLGHTDSPV